MTIEIVQSVPISASSAPSSLFCLFTYLVAILNRLLRKYHEVWRLFQARDHEQSHCGCCFLMLLLLLLSYTCRLTQTPGTTTVTVTPKHCVSNILSRDSTTVSIHCCARGGEEVMWRRCEVQRSGSKSSSLCFWWECVVFHTTRRSIIILSINLSLLLERFLLLLLLFAFSAAPPFGLFQQQPKQCNNKETAVKSKIHFFLSTMENEYESLRESNIERNKKFLKDIGLESNIIREHETNNNHASRSDNKIQKKKRKFPTVTAEQAVTSRRSLRIATLPAPSYKVNISNLLIHCTSTNYNNNAPLPHTHPTVSHTLMQAHWPATASFCSFIKTIIS